MVAKHSFKARIKLVKRLSLITGRSKSWERVELTAFLIFGTYQT